MQCSAQWRKDKKTKRWCFLIDRHHQHQQVGDMCDYIDFISLSSPPERCGLDDGLLAPLDFSFNQWIMLENHSIQYSVTSDLGKFCVLPEIRDRITVYISKNLQQYFWDWKWPTPPPSEFFSSKIHPIFRRQSSPTLSPHFQTLQLIADSVFVVILVEFDKCRIWDEQACL